MRDIMEEDYFYNIHVDYDIKALSRELTDYVQKVLEETPDHGVFSNSNDEKDTYYKFRYIKILNNDIEDLPVTNYLREYLEDELDIPMMKNIPVAFTPPGNESMPHRDGSGDRVYNFAINFPLFEKDPGSTIFYEEYPNSNPDVSGTLVTDKKYFPVDLKYQKNLKRVYEIKMDCPKLIRTEKYHSTTNKGTIDRFNVSFRTNPMENNLSWYDVLERVKDHNKRNS